MREEIKIGYTRVSDVASAYANYGKVPKNILDYAADRGTRIHEIIHLITNDLPVPDKLMTFCGKPLSGYIESFEKFWNLWNLRTEILHQEKRFYDEELKITGSPDMIARQDGQVFILDWKATQKVGLHWKIQASGYLYQPWVDKIGTVLFVKLDKDGKSPIVEQYQPDKSVFKKCFELYNEYMKDQTFNMEYE